MNVNLVESFAEAEAFMSWLSERRPVLAIDTETAGLEWWRDPLRLVQFGDSETGWAVPFHLWGGLALEAASKYDKPIAYHNAKFDIRYLEINGATLNRRESHDTRVMAHLLYPGFSSGLKSTSTRILGANSQDWEDALHKQFVKNKWTWATVPVTLPEYWEYACVDTILTARLFERLYRKFDDRLRTVYDLEMTVQWIIDAMERKGVRIDKTYSYEQAEILHTFAQESRKYCVETWGFGPGQNKSIASQLQRDGVLLTKQTNGGAWSVDQSVLKKLDHPLAKLVLNVRKAEKYENSYFRNYLNMADGIYLHPDVNTLGARTGRMSISRPALQQIPREALLRNAFIPREGNRLVSVDYDQIEMRLFTHYCQDPGLIEAFNQEGDFFLNAASRIYRTQVTDKKDPRRQLTKNGSYATIYGAGPSKFAITAGIPEEAGQAFMADYHATFPGVRMFMQQLTELAKQRGVETGTLYVNTPLGRRETCGSKETYKLVNYLVQGAAADTFKQALVELDRYGLTPYMVLPIHDEVVFDVPEAEADEFGRTAAAIMKRDDFVVPLTCGHDVLERWGDKYGETTFLQWEVEDD